MKAEFVNSFLKIFPFHYSDNLSHSRYLIVDIFERKNHATLSQPFERKC
jgi:hypothetical protein